MAYFDPTRNLADTFVWWISLVWSRDVVWLVCKYFSALSMDVSQAVSGWLYNYHGFQLGDNHLYNVPSQKIKVLDWCLFKFIFRGTLGRRCDSTLTHAEGCKSDIDRPGLYALFRSGILVAQSSVVLNTARRSRRLAPALFVCQQVESAALCQWSSIIDQVQHRIC